MALTGKVQPYKAGFGPFPPEIYHAPFPCHCASLDETKKAVAQLFKADIEASRVAAIVFEPVQGEGGFNVIQPEAVRWLRELCDEHGIVLDRRRGADRFRPHRPACSRWSTSASCPTSSSAPSRWRRACRCRR